MKAVFPKNILQHFSKQAYIVTFGMFAVCIHKVELSYAVSTDLISILTT